MLTIRAHNGWSTFHVNQNLKSRHTNEIQNVLEKIYTHAFHLPPAWSLHHQKCNNKKTKIPSLQQHSISHYHLLLIQCESRIALWLITSITSTTASSPLPPVLADIISFAILIQSQFWKAPNRQDWYRPFDLSDDRACIATNISSRTASGLGEYLNNHYIFVGFSKCNIFCSHTPILHLKIANSPSHHRLSWFLNDRIEI